MNLLHEIAAVGEVGQDRDELVKTILKNMVATMTDRAQVMKFVNSKLANVKK